MFSLGKRPLGILLQERIPEALVRGKVSGLVTV